MELKTERLLLREWRQSDFKYFAHYFSKEENTRFIGGIKNKEEAWRLMASYIGHQKLKGYSYMAVEEMASKKFVGAVGLWNSEPWPELELGYWLLDEMQGKGYATEAALKMKNFAFKDLKTKTLVSYIHTNNQASKNVAERLGGVYEEDFELLDFGLHGVFRYSNKR